MNATNCGVCQQVEATGGLPIVRKAKLRCDIEWGGGSLAAAGRGLAGGFFGCLGVLGAVLFLGLALAMWGGLSSRSFSDRLSRGEARADELAAFCGAATSIVEREYPRWGEVTASSDAPTILESNARPVIACRAATARHGVILMDVRVLCADPLQGRCVRLEGPPRR